MVCEWALCQLGRRKSAKVPPSCGPGGPTRSSSVTACSKRPLPHFQPADPWKKRASHVFATRKRCDRPAGAPLHNAETLRQTGLRTPSQRGNAAQTGQRTPSHLEQGAASGRRTPSHLEQGAASGRRTPSQPDLEALPKPPCAGLRRLGEGRQIRTTARTDGEGRQIRMSASAYTGWFSRHRSST